MAQPLRKIFQKNLLSGADAAAQGWRERGAREDGAPRGRPAENSRRQTREARAAGRPRRTLDLSAAATVALGLALVAAVGWSFFMGYLVGRGEHPERGVESVTGLLRPKGPAPGAPAGVAAAMPQDSALLPGEEALRPQAEAPGTPGAPAAPGAARGAEQEAAPAAPPVAEAPARGPAAAQGAPQAPARAQAASGAYPFSRPQGEGLAAWGIREGAATASTPASGAREGQPAPGQAPAPGAPAARATPAVTAPKAAEPRFDYLFQAAAFKGPVDAERLRARLEGAGLRARVRQSGKVRLVLVSVRGGARDAARVRGELSAMGLGKPIQLEKKPVPEPTGGKGRRRSAP